MSAGTILILVLLVLFIYLAVTGKLGTLATALYTVFPNAQKAK